MKFKYAAGITPLDRDELDGLKPGHIATQGQLDEWESANIAKARIWLFHKAKHRTCLTIDFIKLLHKKMFNETWKWAGCFRKTEKNIGIDPCEIPVALKNLLDDVVYQIENAIYPIEEIACRFHHRLVWIHPFSNGNGRHARMMADVLLVQNFKPSFTWGAHKRETSKSHIRKQYIDALRQADKGDYTKLLVFVRM